jgi:hypothetical protein
MKDVLLARSQYFVEQRGDDEDYKKQLSGAFCTGSYSYVWNTADSLRIARTKLGSDLVKGRLINTSRLNDFLSKDGKNTIVVKTGDDKYLVPKFIRFVDTNRDACRSSRVDRTLSGGNHFVYYTMAGNISGTIKEDSHSTFIKINSYESNVTELIAENEADLALYDFSVVPATQNYSTYQIFYAGSFILATYRGGVNIHANGDFCQSANSPDLGTGSEYTGNDFDYCAVNKFNFAVRATGDTGVDVHGGS